MGLASLGNAFRPSTSAVFGAARNRPVGAWPKPSPKGSFEFPKVEERLAGVGIFSPRIFFVGCESSMAAGSCSGWVEGASPAKAGRVAEVELSSSIAVRTDESGSDTLGLKCFLLQSAHSLSQFLPSRPWCLPSSCHGPSPLPSGTAEDSWSRKTPASIAESLCSL